tara:strand:+ start:2018 stop:2161 length:144 start_codon:yes stop_codon:yes gene_type:complete
MARDVMNEERGREGERFFLKYEGRASLLWTIGVFMNNRCLKRNFTSV